MATASCMTIFSGFRCFGKALPHFSDKNGVTLQAVGHLKKCGMSPKFKELNGFVFKIYSNEETRIHIHIIKAEKEAKYWLEPNIELAENYGFNSKELSFIEKILTENGDYFKVKFARHVGKRLDDK